MTVLRHVSRTLVLYEITVVLSFGTITQQLHLRKYTYVHRSKKDSPCRWPISSPFSWLLWSFCRVLLLISLRTTAFLYLGRSAVSWDLVEWKLLHGVLFKCIIGGMFYCYYRRNFEPICQDSIIVGCQILNYTVSVLICWLDLVQSRVW